MVTAPQKHATMTSQAALFPKAVRHGLRAVVIDANAYGNIGPDIAHLAELATDLDDQLGLETWLPEPVAWEWAEHLAKEWTSARTATRRQFGNLRRSGVPVTFEPDYDDRDAVINAFMDRLKAIPLIVLVELSGESARSGIKDQILLHPPAKEKSTPAVKTGASDSAWLRDVIARAEGDPSRLLFLSSDHDIETAFTAWNLGSPLLCSRDEIRDRLFDSVPAAIEDEWNIARYLVKRLPEDTARPETPDGSPLVTAISGLGKVLDPESFHDNGLSNINLTELTGLTGLANTRWRRPEPPEDEAAAGGSKANDAPDGPRTMTATAFLLGEAEATVTVHDDVEDEPDTWSVGSGAFVVRAPLVFEVDGTTIVSARQDGEAGTIAIERFWDSDDAVRDIVDTLTLVPGLRELTLDDLEGVETYETTLGAVGTSMRIELHGELGGVSVQVANRAAHVECHHDETTWIGGREGMDMEPPFFVSANFTTEPFQGGPWALSAWVIAAVVDAEAADSAAAQ
jgi:hypothetical protein